MNKSYVTMETHICWVCGKEHDTGTILMDRRSAKVFDQHTVTGHSLCPEHQKLYDEGYVALIEVKNHVRGSLKLEDANRTGRVAHMRRNVFKDVTGMDSKSHPIIFVEDGFVAQLEKLTSGG